MKGLPDVTQPSVLFHRLTSWIHPSCRVKCCRWDTMPPPLSRLLGRAKPQHPCWKGLSSCFWSHTVCLKHVNDAQRSVFIWNHQTHLCRWTKAFYLQKVILSGLAETLFSELRGPNELFDCASEHWGWLTEILADNVTPRVDTEAEV